MNEASINTLLHEELRKFSCLCAQAKSSMPMFSEFIDQYWHNLIVKRYDLFNLPFHDTKTKSSKSIYIEWVADYEQYYGKLDRTWFMDKKGNLLKNKYDKYLASGKVFSSFNCAGRIV